MEYVELIVELKPVSPWCNILMSAMVENDYDTFEENEKGFKAYIKKKDFNEAYLKQLFAEYSDVSISYTSSIIPETNWNANWESSFQPIEIGSWCLVRAPFHNIEKAFEVEIVIEPKMSFGTGHHQTTMLMMEEMKNIDWKGKRVLDMGSGTGILAILAEKLGARDLIAIDNDEWAYANCIENVERNACEKITTILGTAANIDDKGFDVILANINRNILMADMPAYTKALDSGGVILFSGFLEQDVEVLKEKIAAVGLLFDKVISNAAGNFALIKCFK
ncbi:MAG: 50S ribosomal protein L11 methyltransferase [Bacteroidetes bacterium]|nr:50S ribosomal protein L11 methyltransferase [Bacteroidota bacterium]